MKRTLSHFFERDQGLHFVEILQIAYGKVAKAHHALIQLEQGFQKVAADKPSHAGHQSYFGFGDQLVLQFSVCSHRKLTIADPSPRRGRGISGHKPHVSQRQSYELPRPPSP